MRTTQLDLFSFDELSVSSQQTAICNESDKLANEGPTSYDINRAAWTETIIKCIQHYGGHMGGYTLPTPDNAARFHFEGPAVTSDARDSLLRLKLHFKGSSNPNNAIMETIFRDSIKATCENLKSLFSTDARMSWTNKSLLADAIRDAVDEMTAQWFQEVESRFTDAALVTRIKGREKEYTADGVQWINPMQGQPTIKQEAARILGETGRVTPLDVELLLERIVRS